MLNIGFYLRHFPASATPIVGGTATFIDGLASGLHEIGAAVSVLCEGGERSSATVPGGYRVECFPAARRRFDIAPAFKRYLNEQAGAANALLVIAGMFHPGVYAVGRAAAAGGVPYVACPFDPYSPAVFRRNAHLKWPYWFLFERRLLAHAAAVQVMDRRHAELLSRLGIRTPAIEVPNGFPAHIVPQTVEPCRAAAAEPVRMLFLGRIDAYNKGLDILLNAFGLVAMSHDVRLTIQGPDWGDRARLQRQAARLSLLDKVTFRDADYGRTGPEIIGDHDLFCLPSRFEGFSQSAIEAMLAARMVLVSEIAGIAPHVEAAGCGLAVKLDAAAVANGMVTLLQDRTHWKARGLDGRAYALSKLPWKNVAADALRQYHALAASANAIGHPPPAADALSTALRGRGITEGKEA
jgi:glycosyltransferase involved in cell wall biosynthesis